MRGVRRNAIILFSALTLSAADPDTLDRARRHFARGQYREAVDALGKAASTGPEHELAGKAHFMMGDYKKAVESFERAAAAQPGSSGYHHWLGKAWGRRAETSNPLLAPGYASKARQNFEKAVALDGKNLEAVNDLFSYYLEAPGFLGGGLDKAARLATASIQPLDPIEYHYAMAQVSEKRKEFKTAEMHFRRAYELAPRQAGRIIDLAKFLSRQGRHQDSEVLFEQAEKVAPNEPRLLFERASNYIRAGRNLDHARNLLQRYLRSPLTPDDPPRAEAERLLKQAGA